MLFLKLKYIFYIFSFGVIYPNVQWISLLLYQLSINLIEANYIKFENNIYNNYL